MKKGNVGCYNFVNYDYFRVIFFLGGSRRFRLPRIRGTQVDPNHGSDAFPFVVVIGKHGADHQQCYAQQLHFPFIL